MEKLGKVTFDLSLARGLDYYTGMIYEIVLVDKKHELGSISGGGRYDELIGMFSSQQIPSVGGSIGIERLFSIIEEKYKGRVKTNECEILVATAGPVKVEDKLRVLSMLWRAGIKAEVMVGATQTLYVKGSNAKKQMQRAFDAEIPMIVWVGENELNSGKVKLKVRQQFHSGALQKYRTLDSLGKPRSRTEEAHRPIPRRLREGPG